MEVVILCLIVIAFIVYLLLKGWYPQAVLFLGGLILLSFTAIFDWGTILGAKQTTHFVGFDIFKAFGTGFSSRIAGLGLRKLCKIRNFSQSPFGGFISEESDGNFPSGRN